MNPFDQFDVDDDKAPELKVTDGNWRMKKTIADIEAGRPPEWSANWSGAPIDFNNNDMPAPGNPFDVFDSTEIEKIEKPSGIRQVLGSAAATADLVAGLPAWAANLLGRLTTTPVEMVRGYLGKVGPNESPDPAQRAEDKMSKVMNAIPGFSTPVQSAYNAFAGKDSQETVEAPINRAMGAVAESGQTLGEKAGMSPAMSRMALDTTMAVLGPKVAEGVGKIGLDRFVKPTPEEVSSYRTNMGYGEDPVATLAEQFVKKSQNLATLNPKTGKWSEGQIPAELGPMSAEVASKMTPAHVKLIKQAETHLQDTLNAKFQERGLTAEVVNGQHESLLEPTRNQLLDYTHDGRPVEFSVVLKNAEGQQVGFAELMKHEDGSFEVRDINTKEAGKGVGTELQQTLIDSGIPIKPSEYVTDAGKSMQNRINYGPGGKQSGAVDPTVVVDAAKKLMTIARDGAHFADMMVAKYGETIRPFAIQMYNQGSKDAPANYVYSKPGLAKRIISPISALALDIHPEIGQQLIGLESRIKTTISNRIKSVDGFFEKLNKSSPEAQRFINDKLTQNDLTDLRRAIGKEPTMQKMVDQLQETLATIGKELRETGIVEKLREDYFPRVVKDYDGLLKKLGVVERTAISNKIAEAQHMGMSNAEISEIINKELSYTKRSKTPGFAKERVYDEIPVELLEFYASPTESIHTYIRNATERIEMAKFFGKSLVKSEGKVDLPNSIGAYINNLLVEGKLNKAVVQQGGLDTLAEILQARFGNKSMNPTVKSLQNLNYMATMGDVANTMAQLGDVSSTVYQANPINTLKALYVLTNKNRGSKFTTAKDLGLMDHVSEEFVGEMGTDKAVKRLFKLNGLAQLDGFMKTLNLVANRLQAEASIAKPNSRLHRLYKERFGDRFEQLLNDLRQGRRTELTDELLFSELSKFQPISKSEFSLARLNNPNVAGSAMTLKSFMLKQIDNIITESFGEFKKGRPLQGAKNLAALMAITGMTNIIVQDLRDIMQNKSLTYKGEVTDIPKAFFKNIGLDGYFSQKVMEKPAATLASLMLPPVNWVDQAYKDAKTAYNQNAFSKEKFSGKSIKLIPIAGDEIYGWSKYGEKAKKEKEAKEQQEYMKWKFK